MSGLLIQRLAFLLYFLGAAAFLVFVIRRNKKAGQAGNWLIGAGFAFQTAFLVASTVSRGQLPVLNMSQAFCFFGWTLAGCYLVLFWKFRLHVFGAFAAPLALVMAALGAVTGGPGDEVSPVFQSLWMTLHLGTVFIAYGFFGLAFLAGIMYLLQEREIKAKKMGALYHRLPSLNVLDNLNHFCLTYGFPLMTLGIVAGAAYAQSALGSYWRWDPKEVWALIVWLIYAVLLHQRLTVGWRGRRAAIMAIIGFLVLCFTFVGVSLLMPGYHSFESLRAFEGQ